MILHHKAFCLHGCGRRVHKLIVTFDLKCRCSSFCLALGTIMNYSPVIKWIHTVFNFKPFAIKILYLMLNLLN